MSSCFDYHLTDLSIILLIDYHIADLKLSYCWSGVIKLPICLSYCWSGYHTADQNIKSQIEAIILPMAGIILSCQKRYLPVLVHLKVISNAIMFLYRSIGFSLMKSRLFSPVTSTSRCGFLGNCALARGRSSSATRSRSSSCPITMAWQ